MGSSAFLIEAVDQLADAYLEARQEELEKTIPPEAYQREKRRVIGGEHDHPEQRDQRGVHTVQEK